VRVGKGVKPSKISVKKSLRTKRIKLSSEDWYKRAAAAMSIRKESPSIVLGQAGTVRDAQPGSPEGASRQDA
jgi:hypothetical protein